MIYKIKNISIYILLKAFKIRLYPNKNQRELLNSHFGACRFVYNSALNYKMSLYRDYKINVSKFDIIKEIAVVKQDEKFSWLNEVKAECLQNVIDNLDSAFSNFFKGAGFPKFKSKKDKQSFIQKQNFKVLDNSNKLIFFSNKIKFKCSEKDVEALRTQKIKRIVYSKDSLNHYHASFLIDSNENSILEKSDKEVGIDLGLSHFLITSDGEFIENPKFLRKSELKLKREQRKFSKKKKGSSNKEKQRIKVCKIYKKITNQRNHFFHQVSNKLISENQTICIETLNIKGMIKNRKLSKSIQDVSWGRFISILQYKAEWRGRTVSKIGRFEPSSKTCSNCGTIKTDLTLKDRIFKCSNCKMEMDRDLNASKNILKFNRDELSQINASGEQVSRHSLKEEISIKK